jgi:hypothetical protein
MTTVSEPSGNLKLSMYPVYVPESGLDPEEPLELPLLPPASPPPDPPSTL